MKKKGKKTRIEEIHDIKKEKNAKTNLERRPWLVSEDILGDIRDNGGDVRYKKEENTNNVEVLCVQSKEMRKQLTESKPFVFECDTTFGTQAEGYKLYIPVYYSNFTVSGLLFFTSQKLMIVAVEKLCINPV